jgi:CMP-N,N'-diacetyllegionaminic acid synthase
MIEQKKVLAVVPARGGSKGIPLKNLRTVQGRPLVSIAGIVASAVPEIDRKVVSTDHPEIARVAQIAGLDAPFVRPESISGDRISDWDVLCHALLETEAIDGLRYDVVVMLQPTSPLRKPQDVSGVIKMLILGGYDAVWSVSETDSKAHPLKQLTFQNGQMEYWDTRGEGIIARQQLEPTYHRNGVAYAITRECLIEQKTIKGKKTGAYIVPGDHISIDTEWDITLIEFMLNRKISRQNNEDLKHA